MISEINKNYFSDIIVNIVSCDLALLLLIATIYGYDIYTSFCLLFFYFEYLIYFEEFILENLFREYLINFRERLTVLVNQLFR